MLVNFQGGSLISREPLGRLGFPAPRRRPVHLSAASDSGLCSVTLKQAISCHVWSSENQHLILGTKHDFYLFEYHPDLSPLPQVSVVNALDMQVVVSTVPPTLVEEKKDELIR